MSGRLPGRRVRLTGARTEKSPASISATGLAMTYGFSFTDAVTICNAADHGPIDIDRQLIGHDR